MTASSTRSIIATEYEIRQLRSRTRQLLVGYLLLVVASGHEPMNFIVAVKALTSCSTALANVPFSFSFQSGQKGVPKLEPEN